MKKKTIMNISLMTCSNAAVRVLGLLYKIWLAHAISPVALGLYQLSLSLYGVMITPFAGGLPSAVSRLSAKYAREGGQGAVLGSGLKISAVLSLATGGVLLCAAGFFASFFLHDASAWPVVLCLFPAICCGGMATAPAAYLHAMERSALPAGAEVVEQCAKIAFGMAVISLFRISGTVSGAAAAAGAVSFGGVVSMALLLPPALREKKKSGHLKEVLYNAVPLTLARGATSVLHLANTSLLPLRLVAYGLTMEAALAQYGILTSMAYPVVFLPSTVISAICVVLLPQVARAASDKALLKQKLRRAIGASAAISAAFCVFLLLFAPRISRVVFSQPLAGGYMLLLVPCVLLCGINQVLATSLSGLGCQKKLLLTGVLVGLTGVGCTWVLAARGGMTGFIIGNIIQDVLAFLLYGGFLFFEVRRRKE